MVGRSTGPRGFYELAAAASRRQGPNARDERGDAAAVEVSEQLTGVSYPTPGLNRAFPGARRVGDYRRKVPESSIVVRPEPMESGSYTEAPG